MQNLQLGSPESTKAYRSFKRVNGALAAIVGQMCSIKPELSLLIELYDAEAEGKRLSVSSLGLISGIPPTTTLRYLRFMEECGWIDRIPHEFDHRVIHIRLRPTLVAQVSNVFKG